MDDGGTDQFAIGGVEEDSNSMQMDIDFSSIGFRNDDLLNDEAELQTDLINLCQSEGAESASIPPPPPLARKASDLAYSMGRSSSQRSHPSRQHQQIQRNPELQERVRSQVQPQNRRQQHHLQGRQHFEQVEQHMREEDEAGARNIDQEQLATPMGRFERPLSTSPSLLGDDMLLETLGELQDPSSPTLTALSEDVPDMTEHSETGLSNVVDEAVLSRGRASPSNFLAAGHGDTETSTELGNHRGLGADIDSEFMELSMVDDVVKDYTEKAHDGNMAKVDDVVHKDSMEPAGATVSEPQSHVELPAGKVELSDPVQGQKGQASNAQSSRGYDWQSNSTGSGQWGGISSGHNPGMPENPLGGVFIPGMALGALQTTPEGDGLLGSQGINDERRQKRLARNRESARQSRLRKKQHLELLEEKVTQLTATIEDLRRWQLGDAPRAYRETRRQCLADLEEKRLLASIAGGGTASNCKMPLGETKDRRDREAELKRGLQSFFHRLGLGGGERRGVAEYQLKRLESSAAPPPARFLLWLMLQSGGFSQRQYPASGEFEPNTDTSQSSHSHTDSSKDADFSNDAVSEQATSSADLPNLVVSGRADEIWSLLCRELSLTDDQEQKARDRHRSVFADPAMHADSRDVATLASLLADLRVCTQTVMEEIHMRSSKLLNVLSPSQMIQYLIWVSANEERTTKLSQSRVLEAHLQPLTESRKADNRTFMDTGALSSTIARRNEDGESANTENISSRDDVLSLVRLPDEQLSLQDMSRLLRWVKSKRGN